MDENEPPDDPALAELDRRLAVVRDRVRGVALGHHTGFYLYGRAGTSKTFTVRATLDAAGRPWSYHKGHLTPIGLFELLEEHPDEVLFLDDVGEMLRKQVGLQILLAALGNDRHPLGERVVRYRRQGKDAVVRFTGGIVLVSNLELSDSPVMEALKSRVHVLRYEPTDAQVAALMRHIASQGWHKGDANVTQPECLEVAEFLLRESGVRGIPPDIRLLVDKSLPDYLQWSRGETETHWKDLVLTSLEERLGELRHTPALRAGTREGRLEEERQVVREILAAHGSREERLAAWRSRMGEGVSERRFYRRLEEIQAGESGAA